MGINMADLEARYLESYINEIESHIIEEEDKFIYEAVAPYCSGKTKMIISKDILTRALICFKEEHYDEYMALVEKAVSEGEDD